MNNAALAVSESILAAFRCKNIVVVCGRGNNGGDGFAAARFLKDAGLDVTVIFAGDENGFSELSGDAAISAEAWNGETVFSDTDINLTFSNTDLIVDAMLGAGI